MNNRTLFALLAVFTIVGTLTMSSAYAEEGCPNCTLEDVRVAANESLLKIFQYQYGQIKQIMLIMI